MSETAFYILFSLQVPNHGYGIGQEVKKMTQNEIKYKSGNNVWNFVKNGKRRTYHLR